MSQRIAVITGANRGLGFQVARELAAQGYHVILTGRSLVKAEAAAARLADEGLAVEPAELDVSSGESVTAFFDWLAATYGRVDVLVNNAGAIFEGAGQEDPAAATPMVVAPEVLNQAFNNNTVGAYRTIQRTLPMMNEAGFGRIVNVSSGMGALNDMGSGWPAYRLSKASLNALTQIFAAEAGAGVKINSVCPGWVRTDMGGSTATRSVEEGAAGIVWAATLDDDGPTAGFFRDGEPIAW